MNEIQYTVDPETGEVVDAVVPSFSISDESSAEWLMEKIQEMDAEIAAFKLREEAVVQNLTTKRREVERRRDGLLYKYKGELENFAKSNLPTGKKTWTCPYGSVAFRATKARLSVENPDFAMVWAENNAPDAIQTERRFMVSKLDKGLVESLMRYNSDTLKAIGFNRIPEGEAVKIETIKEA